jgi:lipopolysaccharide biosynthesis regulator YciM
MVDFLYYRLAMQFRSILQLRSRVLLVGRFIIMSFAALLCYGQSESNQTIQIRKHLLLGQQFLKQQKAEEAAREFTAVVGLDPRNMEAQANLGVLAFLRGDCVKALPHFHAALNLAANLANIRALLGFCEIRLGEASGGEHDLERAFPNLTDPKLRVQTGLFLLDLYRQAGDVGHATTTVSRLQEVDSDNVDVQYAAYRLYSDLADQAVTAVSVSHGDSARMRQIVAQRLVETGNLDGAIRAYREALELDPHLTGAHYELAQALMHRPSATPSNWSEAGQELQAAVAENPRDAEAECLLGEIALHGNDTQSALSHFSRALSFQPRNPDAHIGLGKIYLSSTQTDKAVAEFKSVIAVEPTNAQAHYSLSHAYRKLGRMKDADDEVKVFQTLRSSQHQLEDVFGRMRTGEPDFVDVKAP